MKRFNPMLIIPHVRDLWNRYADLQKDLDNYYNKGEVDSLIDGVEVDLSNYDTSSEVDTKIDTAIEGIEVDLSLIDYKGTVDNYAELAGLTELENGDAYVNAEDGLVYIWNGTSFPADGDGMDVSMKPIGVVEEGNEFAVSGGAVYDYFKSTFNAYDENKPDSNLKELNYYVS